MNAKNATHDQVTRVQTAAGSVMPCITYAIRLRPKPSRPTARIAPNSP